MIGIVPDILKEALEAISQTNSGGSAQEKGEQLRLAIVSLQNTHGDDDDVYENDLHEMNLMAAVGYSCLAQQVAISDPDNVDVFLDRAETLLGRVEKDAGDYDRCAINYGAYKLATEMNLSRLYLLRGMTAEEGGYLNNAIESYRAAWEIFPPLEEVQEMLANGAEVGGVPVVGAPQEFPDAESYLVKMMGIPYRAMSTAAFEYARRLELKDPTNPEIAELDAEALRIIEAGLKSFGNDKEQLKTVAGVNLRLSACATFGASSLDSLEQAAILEQNLAEIKRDTDALKEAGKITEIKAIEWEMVTKSAELLLMQKQDLMNDPDDVAALRDEILILGHKLGYEMGKVPDYIGINAVYKKALGNEFPELITRIEAGMEERRQEVIARLSTNPDGFEFKKT